MVESLQPEPVAIPATQKQADRVLAEALRQYTEAPNSVSECQQPTRGVVIEVCVWVGTACLIWAGVAATL
jgi:hypothetical protein